MRALGAGAWVTVWPTASYFIGRSHEVNATNLSPMLCAGSAGTLLLLNHHRLNGRASRLIRARPIPVMTVLLAIGFGAKNQLGVAITERRAGYVCAISTRRPWNHSLYEGGVL